MPVDSQRDPLDAWLNAEVELMHPPPGTFERIHRRARRRKAAQALVVAAGAMVLIGGAIAAPNLASFLPGQSQNQTRINGAESRGSSAASHPATAAATPTPSRSSAASLIGPPIGAPSGPRVAAGFRALSVTFVGTHIGAVLGQTTANCPAGPCVALAGTSSYGSGPWYQLGLLPPDAEVSQVRFLDLSNGWAFGPKLWYTTDGGRSWAQSVLTARQTGVTVTDVEALDHKVYALVGSCAGPVATAAANCQSFTLYQARAGTDRWTVVSSLSGLTAGPTAGLVGHAAASLELASSGAGNPGADMGFLLVPTGQLFGGTLLSSWTQLSNARCQPGPALVNGQPSRTVIAAPNAGALFMVCTFPRQQHTVCLWTGAGWAQTGSLPASTGAVRSLAAAPNGRLAVATASGIYTSFSNGASWQLTQPSPGGSGSSAGFSFVGMTTKSLGVAVPADTRLGEVFITRDGGRTWQASRL
jgi:hypothetical protein